MNPLCNYFGYLFINYCLIEQVDQKEPLALTIGSTDDSQTFNIEYQWQYINFTWSSPSSYRNALNKRRYIPENVAMTEIKYYKGDIYMALPQIRNGVPVTLGTISVETSDKFNPLVRPYPNWGMNVKTKDCTTLQSVHSMEIDKSGIMWVLDGFRMNNNTKCPPKLLLLDLNDSGKVILSYIFPKEICLSTGGFLNDIVVDATNEGFAYITDNSLIDPGLIVYSQRQNRAWKLRDRSMFDEENAPEFVVGNLTFNQRAPLAGIALSPPHSQTGNKLLFYSALTGLNLYSIKTKALKDERLINNGDWRRSIRLVGKKQSQGDGLIIDNLGNLFYTLPPLYGVGKWNINTEFSTSKIIAEDRSIMMWPDSFAFDDKGNLRLLTNNINKFVDPSSRLRLTSDVLFRIFKYVTGTKSYV